MTWWQEASQTIERIDSIYYWIYSSASATHPDAEPLEDEDGVEVVAGDDGVAARRVQRAAGHRGG